MSDQDAPSGAAPSSNAGPSADAGQAALPAEPKSAESDGPDLPSNPDEAEPDPGDGPPLLSARGPRLVIAALSVLALIGLVVVGVIATGNTRQQNRTPAVDLIAATLVTPATLAGIAPATSWTETRTLRSSAEDAPHPVCVLSTTDPAPASTALRELTSSQRALVALHSLDRYASVEYAAKAYAARVNELANCPATAVQALAASGIEDLGDEAVAVQVVEEASPRVVHTLLLSRDADALTLLDVTSSRPVDPAAVAHAVALAYQARCLAAGGWCAPQEKVTATEVLPTDPRGWLAPVDLPRVRAAQGVWSGSDVASPAVSGSQCEGADLTKMTGATGTAQRTYLINDDASAPPTFGVDEVRVSFPSAGAASLTLDSLMRNVDGCAGRLATATVRKLFAYTGVVRGASWVVTHQVSPTSTVRFQVGVVARGSRLLYLLGTPSASYGLTDTQWRDVVARAGLRLGQF